MTKVCSRRGAAAKIACRNSPMGWARAEGGQVRCIVDPAAEAT